MQGIRILLYRLRFYKVDDPCDRNAGTSFAAGTNRRFSDMKREKHFWKKLFCFVFLFTVVTGCGSVYAAEHGTVEEKETEDRSGMLEDELEQMEESLLDEFDFRQIDQLSGETELGEKFGFVILQRC